MQSSCRRCLSLYARYDWPLLWSWLCHSESLNLNLIKLSLTSAAPRCCGFLAGTFLPISFLNRSWCFFLLPGGTLQHQPCESPHCALSPAAVRAAFWVADHLPHLYQDAVHAGLARGPPWTLLLLQTVGHRHAVAQAGVVVRVRLPPPSADVLQAAAHGSEDQQGDEAWQHVQSLSEDCGGNSPKPSGRVMLPLVSSSVRTVHVWPGCELVGGGAELLELITTLTAGREGVSVSVSVSVHQTTGLEILLSYLSIQISFK